MPDKTRRDDGKITVGAAPRREKWRNFHRRYRGEGAAPTYQPW